MRQYLRKGLDRFRQAPINIAAVLVFAFFLLFAVFFLWGCAAGRPDPKPDPKHLGAEFQEQPDLQESRRSIFPQTPKYRGDPIVPFDKSSSAADGENRVKETITFPHGLPAEQQSGRSGLVPHKAETYQDLDNSAPVRLADPGRVKTDSKKQTGAIYPDGQISPGSEDWSQRCYILPDNSPDTPENCRRLGQVAAPQIFQDTGIPMNGNIRQR